MWSGVLPVASVPLWQELQLPVMLAWSKLAGTHAVVVWQSSQLSPLAMWVGCLPVATVPLWQDPQVPSTWVWSTVVAGDQEQAGRVAVEPVDETRARAEPVDHSRQQPVDVIAGPPAQVEGDVVGQRGMA